MKTLLEQNDEVRMPSRDHRKIWAAFAVASLLGFVGEVSAGIMSSAVVTGSVIAPDNGGAGTPINTSGETYSIDASDVDFDVDTGVRGSASADIDVQGGSDVEFIQTLTGFGDHAATADLRVDVTLTNDTGTTAGGFVTFDILPGSVSISGDQSQPGVYSSFVEYQILVDGTDRYTGSASADYNNGLFSSSVTGDLGDLNGLVQNGSGAFWDLTSVFINLGEVAAGDSVDLTFLLSGNIAGDTRCPAGSMDCLEVVADFGDPCRGGCGRTPYSLEWDPDQPFFTPLDIPADLTPDIYINGPGPADSRPIPLPIPVDPSPVPVPGTLVLLGLGLWLQRSRRCVPG